ncbi:MAG TPA: surface-adhesin E family protein [Methylotenera sp.]|nr:surface-adhesin E family protein [Methylotenera sp.]
MNHRRKYKKSNEYKYLINFFALSMLVSFDAMSADWTSIKKTNEYELLVDMDSYNESAGLPFITTKTILNKPKGNALNGKNLLYIEEVSTSLFNCKLHAYKVLVTHFFQHNKLVGSKKGVMPFEPLEKGSNNASISSLVCQVHQMVGGQ